MKWFERCGTAQFCGYCNALINKGDALFVIETKVGDHLAHFIRCVGCSGEAAPMHVDEPQRRFNAERPKLAFSFTDVRKLARDGKAAAIAREPGEDDE